MFEKAERQQAKLRLCISGPSGSGKTLGALVLAQVIRGEGKIALIDTENGSASLYANDYNFDVMNMEPPFNPMRFVESIKAAEQAGYTVIIIDSATHEWDGAGGCLAMNEQTARAKFRGNTWSAWSDTTVEHQKFIDAIVHSSAHIICTARSKTETAQNTDGGKKNVVRLGTKLVQRDNFEYEFTLALDLVHDGHFANAIKDRTGLFMDQPPHPITKQTGEVILEWLNNGKSQEDLIEDHIVNIKRAQSLSDLQTIFKDSYKAVTKLNNPELLDRIIHAKDQAKLEFDNQEAA